MLSYADALTKTGCENVETTVRKLRILFAGLVNRMNNERPPKRVMFGGVDGGKGYSGVKEQDSMGCLERDLSLFNLPNEAKHWTLVVMKPGEWFRRVEEAAEQYMERWFVTEKEQVPKRRKLEVQTAQQSMTSMKLGYGRGGKRRRVEEGVATAARLGWFKKIKEAAKTWQWPSF